jgi:hypothetical protein
LGEDEPSAKELTMILNPDSILALATFCTALTNFARAIRALYDALDAKENNDENPGCPGGDGSSCRPRSFGSVPQCPRQVHQVPDRFGSADEVQRRQGKVCQVWDARGQAD